MTIIILAICLFTLASLFYRPEWAAITLFALIISNVNLDIPGSPLNFRALVTILLFMKVLTEKGNQSIQRRFYSLQNSLVLIFFLSYILLVTYGQGLFTFELVKQTLSTFIASYLVFYFYMKNGNMEHLRWGMIIAGLICFADLVYTYAVFGTFPVQRIYLMNAEQEVTDDAFIGTFNHNFFGQICGMAFVYIFCDYILDRSRNKLVVFLLPFMFIGVLMSTSRSALVGILAACLLFVFLLFKRSEQRKTISQLGMYLLGSVVAALLAFPIVSSLFNIDKSFLDQVLFRLVDEPMAIIKRATGQSYNIQNLGSMDWREEASANAYAAFQNLKPIEQVFGIGNGGFVDRDLGHGLNPHNGPLLILIEYGVFGFLIYLLLMAGTIIRAFKLHLYTPSLAIVLFILVYGIGQNGELTANTTFLFVFGVVAEQAFLLKDKPSRMEINQPA